MSKADLKYTSVCSTYVLLEYPQQNPFTIIYMGFWQLGKENLGIFVLIATSDSISFFRLFIIKESLRVTWISYVCLHDVTFCQFDQTGEQASQQHIPNLIWMSVLCYHIILYDFTLFLDVFFKTAV